jgi:uncharacterized membrane protein
MRSAFRTAHVQPAISPEAKMTLLDRPMDQTVSADDPSMQEHEQQGLFPTNVAHGERMVSVAAGAILVWQGLMRRTTPGFIAAGVGAAMVFRGISGRCPMYAALGMNTAESDNSVEEEVASRGVHIEEVFLVNRSPEELYQYWRNFENLPRIMTYLKSVQILDERRSHWVAKAPAIAGGKIEWDAQITADDPNRKIAWRSIEGSSVDHLGRIRFTPGPADRGTEVHVTLDYVPPAGRFGHMVAKLFGKSADLEIREDLRNFKRIMETGEVPTTEGQPHGACAGLGMFRRR